MRDRVQHIIDAAKLAKELDLSPRTARVLVAAGFRSGTAITIYFKSEGGKLAFVKNIGEKSCKEIAWALWKKGYLTHKLRIPKAEDPSLPQKIRSLTE